MKKFLLNLVGYREKVNPSHHSERETIERELAEERRQMAMHHERERLKDQMEKRKEPIDPSSIPSDSAERK